MRAFRRRLADDYGDLLGRPYAHRMVVVFFAKPESVRAYAGREMQPLDNGNWLISWGNGPDMSITEVDPSGVQLLAMRISFDDSIAVTYRAYREASLPDG